MTESSDTGGAEARVPASGRRYADEEVALILRRAAQLDAGSGTGEGLSLPDIERIAREAGIAPELVARAAALVEAGEPGLAARIFGGPTGFHAEYRAAGELPREQFGDVVEAIRRVLGHPGKTSEILDGLEWKSVGEPTQVTVSVRPSAGHTKIQILADRGGAAVIAYLLPGVGALLGGAITGAILEPTVGPGLAIMGTAAATGFVAARTIWSAATRRFRRKFASLVDAVSAQVERGGRDRGEPAAD